MSTMSREEMTYLHDALIGAAISQWSLRIRKIMKFSMEFDDVRQEIALRLWEEMQREKWAPGTNAYHAGAKATGLMLRSCIRHVATGYIDRYGVTDATRDIHDAIDLGRLLRVVNARDRDIVHEFIRGERVIDIARAHGLAKYEVRSHIRRAVTKMSRHAA
jgi:DNA-binding CsgD family transcriptional regulator